MDLEYEERVRVLSILRGREGWYSSYSSISEFKQHLDGDTLAHEELKGGWVLYEKLEQQQIITLLKHIVPESLFGYSFLTQFWGVVKLEGRHHYLSSSHHPFCIGGIRKGVCWYRKVSRDHVYVVDFGGGDEELLGGVGRAYRNKQPESSPDLGLYSTHEFPMRDEAASCGFKCYMAVPLFDSHTDHSYGVLEILYRSPSIMKDILCNLDEAIQIAGLRSTHNSISISGSTNKMQQPESEITEVLESAMETVPRLYLAQVWVPCQQCVNITTNFCCMELASFIDYQSKIVNSWNSIDHHVNAYLEACEFHKLQIDVSSCHPNLCDLSISKNPLAHYAQRARMSHCFAVSHQSNSNHLYVIQFFLQPKFRQDAYGDYSQHLLLKIMEMNLTSFKFVSGKQLVEESLNPNAIECESIDSLCVMKSYMQNFFELNSTTYSKTVDSCCLRPSSARRDKGWVFRLPRGKRLCENHVTSNSLLVPIFDEKMQDFMKKIAVRSWEHNKWIVQFWAAKMVENRCYLETSDQPYAVGCLAKGLASFRKKCMTHYYFVDDHAREEELGPPGRVFRNEHPEITPDLFYYTKNEFPIRKYAMHCCNRGYLALPIFDEEGNNKCVGVLEFLGFYYSDLRDIGKQLKAAKLCSTDHIDFHPGFLENVPIKTVKCRKKALTEIRHALHLIEGDMPQLHMANVWVPNGECVSSTNSNMSCMELALSTNDIWNDMPTDQVHRIHVQARKGIVGMVLASENKSCFCQNLCEFGIVDQPLSHFEMSERCEVCFAICLQSSHTGYLVYVVEFFLYQGPATYEYVRSFLQFLLPVMKHELRSFKMASGKQLGEELVVEVIDFSNVNQLGSSESEQANVFPVKFQSVQYSQKEHQQTEEQEAEECSAAANSYSNTREKGKEQEADEECSAAANSDSNTREKGKEQLAEECSVGASDSKRREKGKRKTDLILSLEVLKPHFGKKLKDVVEELGYSRSTIKRACREYGIRRWPNRKEHKKNPSLLEEESAGDSEQDTLPSTSNLQPLDASLHRNVTHTNTESAEKVIIKVKYEEDIIRFELCRLSLGLTKLMEEVATRLNLEMGSFKLKYLDEDGDEILLVRDDDFQLCPKRRTATGKTCIQLLVW